MRTRKDRMIIEKPSNFVEGFGYGCNSLVQSVQDSITGLVTRPYIEARRRGLRGFGSGVYQSVSGLFIKPVSGAFDLLSKSTEGCKNTVRQFNWTANRDRVRLPRPFYGNHKMIKNYDRNDAMIVGDILPTVGEGRFADNHYIEMKLVKTAGSNPNFLILTEE